MSTPLRILVVIDGRYPSTGGAEMQARLLARSLAAAGHQVEVAVPRLDPRLPVHEVIDGVPVHRIAYPRVRLVGAAFLCARFCAWLLRRRRQYDAIHVHMAKNLAAMAGLVRPWMRSTLTVKISGAWEFDGGILDPALRRKPLGAFYNRCIRRADTMQCVSRYTRQRLIEAGYAPERLQLIPNAVDLARFAQSPPAAAGGAPTFVFVGRVEPVKGLDTLLQAWKVSGLASTARLVIAGDGTQRPRLLEQARALGIDASVEFPGEVRDVPALLARAFAYVQPSYQEGLSNSVLEAMAAGLPIVATDISGNEDVVNPGENGLLVPPRDAEALAAALRRLAGDRPLAAQLGRQARDFVERRFGLASVLSRLESAYRGEAAHA